MKNLVVQSADAGAIGAPQTALVGEIGLGEILRVLRRRKKVIVAIVLVATSLSAFVAAEITPRYTAASQVVLDPRAFRIANMESVLGDLPADPATVLTQVGIIESRAYAERVVDQLELQGNPAFTPGPSPFELPLRAWLEKPLSVARWLPESLVPPGLANGPASPDVPPPASQRRQQVIQLVLDNLRVEQAGRLISIGFTSIDPEEAARVANAFARVYIDDQRQTKAAATDYAQGWLGERVAELRGELQRTESEIEAYRAAHGLLDLGGTSSAVQQVNDLARQLMTVQTERAERQARLRKLRELRASPGTLPELAAMLAAPTIEALRQQDVALVGQLAQLGQEFGPRHPNMLRVQAERDNVQRRIAIEVDSILRTLANDVTVLGAREQSLVGRLDEAQLIAGEAKQAEVALRELQREAEANRTLYTNFLARYKETGEQQGLIEPETQLVAQASVPLEPSFPKPKLIVAGAFTGSLLVGMLFAFLAEHLDGRLRSSRQAERALGIRNLGLVPRVSRRLRRRPKLKRHLLTQPLSAYAESLRGVDALLNLTADPGPKVILVTSSLPAEGKTTFALSLAATAARAGRKTVIIDLDLRRASVHRQLERTPSAGVGEYLAGTCTLEEVLQVEEELPNLHLLPVRRLPADPPNLLRSAALTELLRRLRETYDTIILDTPPLLGLSDTRLVIQHADQVVFVVRWEKTTAEIALNGVRILREIGAPLVGSVLTQVDVKRHARFRYGDAEQYYGTYSKYYSS